MSLDAQLREEENGRGFVSKVYQEAKNRRKQNEMNGYHNEQHKYGRENDLTSNQIRLMVECQCH